MLLPSATSEYSLAGATTLKVNGLGKEYRLFQSPQQRLWSMLGGRRNYASHWALRGVSLELKRGQCLGLIGDNGAGKSSLLKLLAGTMQPSEGHIERSGRVTAILELGAGFQPMHGGNGIATVRPQARRRAATRLRRPGACGPWRGVR